MKLYVLATAALLAMARPSSHPPLAPIPLPVAANRPAAPAQPKAEKVSGVAAKPQPRISVDPRPALQLPNLPTAPLASVASKVASDPRSAVMKVAQSCLGWHEKTGHNDGAEIDRILGSVGLAGSRNPYCAAFVYYCGKTAGFPHLYPRSAWSPDMAASPTWTRAKGGREPQPADAFGIYFASKGRIAHTGLIERNRGNVFETIEGNTSPEAAPGSAADRDGGGVYRRRRLRTQIHSVRDWVSSPASR